MVQQALKHILKTLPQRAGTSVPLSESGSDEVAMRVEIGIGWFFKLGNVLAHDDNKNNN